MRVSWPSLLLGLALPLLGAATCEPNRSEDEDESGCSGTTRIELDASQRMAVVHWSADFVGRRDLATSVWFGGDVVLAEPLQADWLLLETDVDDEQPKIRLWRNHPSGTSGRAYFSETQDGDALPLQRSLTLTLSDDATGTTIVSVNGCAMVDAPGTQGHVEVTQTVE